MKIASFENQSLSKSSGGKSQRLQDLAVDTFQDYKTKFENGDITANDLAKAVQEKQLKLLTLPKRAELAKKAAQVTPEQADVEAETKAIFIDIVIDIKDISESSRSKIKKA